MCGGVTFGDEVEYLALKVLHAGEVRSGESFSLKNREPLLDLVHPRTMNGGEMKAESRMLSEPCLNLLALMQDQVVADYMDERH